MAWARAGRNRAAALRDRTVASDVDSANAPTSPRHLSPQPVRLTLAERFQLANTLVLLVGTLVVGAWVGAQIETGVLNRTASVTALYVDSIISPHLQSLAEGGNLAPRDEWALTELVGEHLLSQQVVGFKVWSPAGVILHSPDERLVGQAFPHDPGLARALRGEVSAHLSNLEEAENAYERERWDRLLEVYAPVRAHASGKIIGVTEFYQHPDDLVAEINAARIRSWGVMALVGLATYALLAGIVKRGSDTIVAQDSALRERVAQLSALLDQNARLHQRVRSAGARTTAINEQALRRVSADLHDGPGQALALALLRLEGLKSRPDCATCDPSSHDFAVVQGAVRDALAETRAISAGLRLPELATLSVEDVAGRAVRDHERRSGTRVALYVHDVSKAAPLAVKIALHRGLQEALSSATRHGQGRGVRAEVWAEGGVLWLRVRDEGPGFDPAYAETDGHLGLAGMRERAELLEGSFAIRAAPGAGTTVELAWPLHAEEAE
jgi:signal transduction histidine kinase